MSPLVELYDPANLQRVFDAGATLIGVNNRDLHTFQTDLNHTLRLASGFLTSACSWLKAGYTRRSDVARLQAAGVDAILVGESLMREPDIGRRRWTSCWAARRAIRRTSS